MEGETLVTLLVTLQDSVELSGSDEDRSRDGSRGQLQDGAETDEVGGAL